MQSNEFWSYMFWFEVDIDDKINSWFSVFPIVEIDATVKNFSVLVLLWTFNDCQLNFQLIDVTVKFLAFVSFVWLVNVV